MSEPEFKEVEGDSLQVL